MKRNNKTDKLPANFIRQKKVRGHKIIQNKK